jgi:hypothetical protein
VPPDDYAHLESRLLGLMARPDIPDDEFNALALALYRFQRKWNRPYDNYCRHLGAETEPSDWRSIPAAPQTAFKQFPLRSFPENLTAKTFRTSGTTGEGFGEHHFLSTRLYDEAILRGWDFFELPVLPQILLTPSPEEAPHSSLSHMMGVLRARAANGEQHFCLAQQSGAGRASGPDWELFSSLLLRAPSVPILLMGTALAFLHWFERGEKIRLPAGSFALETGGYKGSGRTLEKSRLYEMFGAHLGLAPECVINEYGMTELSSQFYTRGVGNPHRSPPWMRAQVIDPETGAEAAPGETGVLRIFDLANLGSVMAIQTRDLAIRLETGFALLGRDPAAPPRGCSLTARP